MESIKLLRLSQLNSKSIFMGKIKYSQLKDKVTITKRNVADVSTYQREFDKQRVKNISDFLDKIDSKVCPFPTPIILAIDSETDIKVYRKKEKLCDNEMIFDNYIKLEEPMPILINNKANSDLDEENINDFFELYIPNNIKNIFIVDGQHRYKGIEKFLESNEYINDIEISVTFLINYDIYEQSEVFANINFKQKPVNKSLYYDIFGVMPGRNEFTFTHYLVSSINKSTELHGLIKMLGKGNGIVSLAFMVETINKYLLGYKGKVYKLFDEYTKLDTIEEKIKDLKSEDNPDMNEIKKLSEELFKDYSYKKIPKIFIDYLNFYQIEFENYIPKTNSDGNYKSLEYKYYMFKATGMLGIIKILNDLIENDMLDINNYKKEDFYKKLKTEMSLIIDKQDFFFNDERFKSSASASLQSTFYKMLHSAIFEKKYKKHNREFPNEEYKFN